MTSTQYLLLGYGVALGLLWGYAIYLWSLAASLRRREAANDQS